MPAIHGTRRAEELDAHATSTGLDHGRAKLVAVVPRRGSRHGAGPVRGGTTRFFVHIDPFSTRLAPGRSHAAASTIGRGSDLAGGQLVATTTLTRPRPARLILMSGGNVDPIAIVGLALPEMILPMCSSLGFKVLS
jgi:hypothetical protein